MSGGKPSNMASIWQVKVEFEVQCLYFDAPDQCWRWVFSLFGLAAPGCMNQGFSLVLGCVPAAVTQVDAAHEGDVLVDDDRLLVVRPQIDAVRMPQHLMTRSNISKLRMAW